jgi:phosphatidylserine decarboxylase
MPGNMFKRIAHGASRQIGVLADIRVPSPLLRPVIRAYSTAMGVRMDEAEIPEGGFERFGDFFARRLKDGARAMCEDPDAVVSPCDGRLVAVHSLSDDATRGLVVKGYDYNLSKLLGGPVGDRFAGGQGCVIYLHPRDYHRVHVPMDAQLHEVRHISGTRFPVAPWSESRVEGLYEKNERMVFHFRVGKGHMALVMVAAFGVGHIETALGPHPGEHTSAARLHDPAATLHKGDEIGAFRLGSTVVLLWSRGLINALPAPGRLLFGQRIGSHMKEAT